MVRWTRVGMDGVRAAPACSRLNEWTSLSISKVDRFLKSQAKVSYSRAKHAKVVLNLALGLALRYEAIPRNPVLGTSRLRRPPSQAMALTVTQVEAIRQAVRTWRRGGGLSGPKPDRQLEAIIEVMLGTSARIGEVLAIRKCDVDVTCSPPTVRICGTVVSPKGKPTFRQGHPKTSKSRRTISVPTFTAEVLRQRLVAVSQEGPEHLVFFSRNHTPLTTNNVRRRLRAILDEAGIRDVTPHSFRRTVATVLDRAGGADLAAEMLGHTSSEITKAYYIEPDDRVNPVTAEILESLAAGRWWPPDPIVSPVNAVLDGAPPLDILIGDLDILRPAVDGLAGRARRSSVSLHVHKVPAMFHVWMTRAIPEGRRTRRFLVELVRQRTQG